MSPWIHSIRQAWLCTLYLAIGGMAYAEPETVLRYSFTVITWVGELTEDARVPAKALELDYKSMADCEEGQNKVRAFLENTNEKKFGYLIQDCRKVERVVPHVEQEQ